MVNCYTGKHEVGSQLCIPDEHCFSCNKDEQKTKRTYIVCFECGHVYTKLGLKLAYIRQAIRAYRFQKKHYYSSQGDGYIRIVLRKLNKIFFCQECMHDF